MKLSKLIKQRGFTMIELLVVIAVIGVLAVAVLSSINPIEQVNKGRDTRTRSDAAQLLNAVDRYFAIQEIYPWNNPGYLAEAATLPSLGVNFNEATVGDEAGWIQLLADTAEVKQQYIERLAQDDQIYIYKPEDVANVPATVYACFSPRSRQFHEEAVRKCGFDLTPNEDVFCVEESEYICLP